MEKIKLAEVKLAEVVTRKPNLKFYLLVSLIWVFVIPIIHNLGKILLLLVYDIPIGKIRINSLIGESYFLIAAEYYTKLTPIQTYLLWVIDPFLLIFYGLLSLLIKNIWYRIFALATLLDSCLYFFLILTSNLFFLYDINVQIFFSFCFFLVFIYSLVLMIAIIFDLYQIIPFQLEVSNKGRNLIMKYSPKIYLFSYKTKLILQRVD